MFIIAQKKETKHSYHLQLLNIDYHKKFTIFYGKIIKTTQVKFIENKYITITT